MATEVGQSATYTYRKGMTHLRTCVPRFPFSTPFVDGSGPIVPGGASFSGLVKSLNRFGQYTVGGSVGLQSSWEYHESLRMTGSGSRLASITRAANSLTWSSNTADSVEHLKRAPVHHWPESP